MTDVFGKLDISIGAKSREAKKYARTFMSLNKADPVTGFISHADNP